MKKGKLFKKLACFVLSATTCFLCFGCEASIRAINLMDNVTAEEVQVENDLKSQNLAVTDFAVRLFANTHQNANTLISPLSVLYALAMVLNGAEGETLAQIENVLQISRDDLNEYLYSYAKNLPQGDKYKLLLANSVWLKQDEKFTVNPEFLQTNANYYGADIYKTPFDKQRTLKDINNWVSNKTDGMIKQALDKIEEDAIAYLINTLLFEAEWTSIYERDQVRDGVFTNQNGEAQNVDFMYSTEGKYLQNQKATGVVKYYKGMKYAFVAMLPNQGVTVSEYINWLTGETLAQTLNNAYSCTVKTAIPKFETNFGVEMSEILKNMGITEAFNVTKANFSRLGRYEGENIFINRVIHKTSIKVGEKGTKAGAVTIIEMGKGTSAEPGKIKQVFLDRPFVYMLIDCENNIPFFMGAVTDINT